MLEYHDIVSLCLEVDGCRNLDPLLYCDCYVTIGRKVWFFKARIPNNRSMMVLREVIGADRGRQLSFQFFLIFLIYFNIYNNFIIQ